MVTFDHIIKSIIPGSEENLLLIETYDSLAKSQTFLLLNIEALEIIQAISFGSDYSGMIAKSFNTERILFIQYSDQNNPDKTNIFSFSWNGGDPVLNLQNTRIVSTGNDWIQIPHPNFESRKVYIDVQSGDQLKDSPVESSNLSIPIKYASSYTEDSEYFQWFVQYFSKHDIEPCKQIEYLKTENSILISYYELQNNQLTNSLAFLNKEGMIIDTVNLEEKLTGIGKDTFFVIGNKAIFVTQKSTLNLYEI